MGQTQQHLDVPQEAITLRNASVAVAVAGNTTILTVPVASCRGKELGVLIANAATGAALDAFVVQYQYNPDGAFVTVASAAGDFTTPNWPVVKASASPVTLVTSGSVWFQLDVRGVYAVQILASANTNPATVTIDATVR